MQAVIELLGDHHTAMAAQLHHILASIAAGSPKEEGHALVQRFTPGDEMTKQSGIAFCFAHLFVRIHRPEHLLGDPVTFRAGQPHHCDTARTGRRCQCHDGRFHLHSPILKTA